MKKAPSLRDLAQTAYEKKYKKEAMTSNLPTVGDVLYQGTYKNRALKKRLNYANTEGAEPLPAIKSGLTKRAGKTYKEPKYTSGVPKRKATSAQLAALAKGRATRAANLAAKKK